MTKLTLSVDVYIRAQDVDVYIRAEGVNVYIRAQDTVKYTLLTSVL